MESASGPMDRVLEQPYLLNYIMDFLPFPDLKSCRAVSHLWNSEASYICRKRSKIVLHTKRKLPASFKLEKIGNVPSFCVAIQTVNMQYIRLKPMFGTMASSIKYLELVDFLCCPAELKVLLTETVPNLEHLAIHGLLLGENTKLFGEEQVLLPKIKSLDLQLHCSKGPVLTQNEKVQMFLESILSATINLRSIGTQSQAKGNKEKCFRLILETIIDKPQIRLPHLNRFHFPFTPWCDEQLHKLRIKDLPLNYLSLTILPTVNMDEVFNLIASLSQCLVKLKLTFVYWKFVEFPESIELNRLRYLNLDWFNGPLDFIRRLPVLEKLILTQVDQEETFLKTKDVTIPTALTTLEIYQLVGVPIFSQTVDIMSSMFPKLKRLVLTKLNDSSMSAVFKAFPNLEEFSALEGLFTDIGVTGIDMPTCDLCKKPHKGGSCRINTFYPGPITRKYYYIGDLKYLRKLELKSPFLTNASVFHGLIYCDRLSSLVLWSYGLTHTSLRRLTGKQSLKYLETTHIINSNYELVHAILSMRPGTLVLNSMPLPSHSRDPTHRKEVTTVTLS